MQIRSIGIDLGKTTFHLSGQVDEWMDTRTARNVVIVATANKLARISWAVLASGNDYHPLHKAAVFSN